MFGGSVLLGAGRHAGFHFLYDSQQENRRDFQAGDQHALSEEAFRAKLLTTALLHCSIPSSQGFYTFLFEEPGPVALVLTATQDTT